MIGKEMIVQVFLDRVIGGVVSYHVNYTNRKQPIGPFPIRYANRKEYDDGGLAVEVYGNYFFATSTDPKGLLVRNWSTYEGEVGLLEKFLKFVVEDMGVESFYIEIPHNLNVLTGASKPPTHYVVDVIYKTPRILFGWNFKTKITNWYCTCGEGPNPIPQEYQEEFVVFVAPWAHEFYITTNLTYRHPHVFGGGKVCVGNANLEYLSEDKFYAAKYVASNLLSHVNFDSLANKVSSESKFYEFLEKTSCPRCGRPPMTMGCPACGEDIYEEAYCEVCGETVCADCIYHAELSSIFYCRRCSSEFSDCKSCGRTGYYEDMVWSDSQEEYYCESCWGELFFYCYHCDEDHDKRYVAVYSCTKCKDEVCAYKVVEVGGKLYCPTCYESNVIECKVCGGDYDYEEDEFVCEVCGETVCAECGQNHNCEEYEEEFYDEE